MTYEVLRIHNGHKNITLFVKKNNKAFLIRFVLFCLRIQIVAGIQHGFNAYFHVIAWLA